jgi:RND family efflux transporter MFP subunit
MKNWIIIVALLGVAFGGYSAWNWQKTRKTSDPLARPSTATIELRNINFVVTAAGDIGPDGMVSVRPEINGRIADLPVDIGDKVTRGTLLCALDDRDLQTELASQITQIEGAQLQLEKAKRNYERSHRLYENKLIAQEVYDDTATEHELAKNALERAQKAKGLVEDKLLKTRIIAPVDCTILTRPVSIGQAVSGSGGVSGGSEIMTIANLKEMIITAHMNQADVPRLKLGQLVDVEVEAVPGLKMKGTVERIAPQATIKNNIKGFATQIRLRDLDQRVRPGMTANLNIPLQSAENAVAIPLAAVFSEQGDRYAYVQKGDGEFEVRPIQIGVADFQFAEVLSGLQSGEVVSLVRPEKADKPVSGAHASLENEPGTNKTGRRQPQKEANATALATNRPAAAAR